MNILRLSMGFNKYFDYLFSYQLSLHSDKLSKVNSKIENFHTYVGLDTVVLLVNILPRGRVHSNINSNQSVVIDASVYTNLLTYEYNIEGESCFSGPRCITNCQISGFKTSTDAPTLYLICHLKLIKTYKHISELEVTSPYNLKRLFFSYQKLFFKEGFSFLKRN